VRPVAAGEETVTIKPRRGNLTVLLLSVREKVRKDFMPVLRDFGINNQQWRILRVLYDKGDSGITQIADDCVIMRPSVATIVPRLEAMGLVTRRKVDGDKRRNDVSITQKGKDLVEQILPILDRVYESFEEKLGVEQLDELFNVLNRVNSKL
jgi:homoprotocatechuate degradation regulator HpaR